MTDSGLPAGFAGALDMTKPWYTSTGIIGSLMALMAPIIANLAHVTISQADVTMAVDLTTQQMQLVGAVLAFVGRIKATHTIG